MYNFGDTVVFSNPFHGERLTECFLDRETNTFCASCSTLTCLMFAVNQFLLNICDPESAEGQIDLTIKVSVCVEVGVSDSTQCVSIELVDIVVDVHVGVVVAAEIDVVRCQSGRYGSYRKEEADNINL